MKKMVWLGVALVIAGTALPALAVDRGVYLVEGTGNYYFVDDGGRSHVIRDYDSIHSRFFADMPVIKTQLETISALPAGEVITETTAPDVVVRKTTTTTTTVNEPAHLDSGVYAVEGGSDYYFIDNAGHRHLINGWDTARSRWFSDMPVHKTRLQLIETLPAGEAITETVGPDQVIKKTTTTTTEEVR